MQLFLSRRTNDVQTALSVFKKWMHSLLGDLYEIELLFVSKFERVA